MPELMILAEAGGSGANVPIVILLAALAAFAIAYVIVGPGRQRRGPKRHGDIPLAMRPYHSDEELETTGMERAMSWGVALAVFASLFVPLYWLIEPERINNRVDDFYDQDVQAGRALFAEACASCHGTNLEGGSAPHPNPDIDAPWPAPAMDNIVARYQDSEIVDDVHEFIMLTLIHGRAGTPMNAFGVANGGVYSDQQLEAITAYILSVQTGVLPEVEAFVGRSGDDLFDQHCARCHGPQAEGYVGPQLINVFERYGWDPDDEASLEQARAAILDTLRIGRNVPGEAPMPAYEGVITEEAMVAIVDYLESFQQTGGPRAGQIGGEPTATDDADDADATDEQES